MTAPRHCLVVGAGVAGAAMARALADKGWQVDVADIAHATAAGASGVPIGVLSCLSTLTRSSEIGSPLEASCKKPRIT